MANKKSLTNNYNLGNTSLTIRFKHFVFLDLFFSNSNFNNSFEILSITVSFVNFLFTSTIKFCILLTSTKMSKSFFSRFILINSQ